MAATLDRLSGGRLLVNLVTGGDAEELAGDGQFLDHAARYEESAEFIRIWREVLRAATMAKLRLRRQAPACQGRKAAVPAGEPTLSAGVLRRLVRTRARARRRAGGHLSHLGRAARGRGRQGGRRARARREARPHAAVRHPPARDRARDRGRSLARRRRAGVRARREDRRRRAGQVRADGFGRPAAHGRAAQRPLRQERHPQGPGDRAQPVGRGRPGARRRRHRAGGQRRAGGRAHQGVRGAGTGLLRAVRLSAPGRGAPLRRTGVPVVAAGAEAPARRSCVDRPFRRDRRQPLRARYHAGRHAGSLPNVEPNRVAA